MNTTFLFHPSVSALMSQGVRPLADLHELSPDVVVSWMSEITVLPIVERGQMLPALRDGTITFHVGSPKNVVTVSAQVTRLMTLDSDETWIGKYVCLRSGSWSWAYHIDWKTGNMVQQIQIGSYPFSYINVAHLVKV